MTINLFGIQIKIKKEAMLVGVMFLAVVTGLIGFTIARSNGGIVIEEKKGGNAGSRAGTAAAADTESGKGNADATEAVKDKIKVYVVGCVRNPGIVTIEKGGLVDDAVRAAGGATEEADLDNINLVYKLKDNVMIYIYSKNEVRAGDKESGAGSGIRIISDSGGAVINSGAAGNTGGAKVNINTAWENELDTLPGIGPATAREIIAYREKNGPFKSVKDIMKVPGIKENKYNNIKNYIAVE